MAANSNATDTRTVVALTSATLRGWGYSPIPCGGGSSGEVPLVPWKDYQRRLAAALGVSDAELFPDIRRKVGARE